MQLGKMLRWTPKFHRWIRRAVLFTAMLAAIWSIGVRWGLDKSDWAAWVQALGSIAAIVVGAWAIRWQVAKQQHLVAIAAQRADIQRLRSQRALLLHAEALLLNAPGKMGSAQVFDPYLRNGYPAEEWDLVLATLAAVEPREIPDTAAKLAFASARKQFQMGMEFMDKRVDQLLNDHRMHLDCVPELEVCVQTFQTRRFDFDARIAAQEDGVAPH